MKSISPLRYPGGKAKIYNYIKNIIDTNELTGTTYIEPFAGGAGLALKLLHKGDVSSIILNDFDFSIYNFWSAVLYHSEDFIKKMVDTSVTIDEWKKQKEIYLKGANEFDLNFAFATFFLNRTNISGIIKGGAIGGLEQKGNYGIDARFNKADLVKRIQLIASISSKIQLYNMDGVEFIKTVLPEKQKVFVNFDPPYVSKASGLYKNSFNEDDHIKLSKAIKACPDKWVLTYDVCPLIRDLYKDFENEYLDIVYTARTKCKAQEYIFFSKDIIIPNGISTAV